MKNRWSDQETASLSKTELLVYSSRLIGLEDQLVLWGGGNTSIKLQQQDHLGRSIRVLLVKGSGSDLKSCQLKDFAPLRLEELVAAELHEEMTDEAMVDYLNRCLVNPKSPRPSIETLMHAFIPYDHVDHTHADAILSITNTKNIHKIFEKLFAQDMVFVPYIKPGFPLARAVAKAFKKSPRSRGAILEKHGIFTWGNSAKESYQTMIEMVTRAEDYVKNFRPNQPPFGKTSSTTADQCQQNYLEIAPKLRGMVGKIQKFILNHSCPPDVVEFANSERGNVISQKGPATPDHLSRTKKSCLFTQKDWVKDLEKYQRDYEAYFARYQDATMKLQDANPRVLIIPQVGMVTLGKDIKSAKIAGDIYQHTIDIFKNASTIDEYESISERDLFEMEYWPLELYKLSLAPPERDLARHIALVTGAASGIGKAVALRLAEEGCHLVIGDVDEARIRNVAQEIKERCGQDLCVPVVMDVTNEDSVKKAFGQAILAFGGLDILISNAGIAMPRSITDLSLEEWEKSFAVNARGHFLCAREAIKIFKTQNMGGNIVFVATKNVMAPGKDFGAYSAAKAAEAQLAKVIAIEYGHLGIRTNIVNPDAVFGDSRLWSETVKKERAEAHGIPVEGLEEFYRKRNLLHTQVTPRDVAEAILFLSTNRSAKITGCTLTVDGGVKEAFPR